MRRIVSWTDSPAKRTIPIRSAEDAVFCDCYAPLFRLTNTRQALKSRARIQSQYNVLTPTRYGHQLLISMFMWDKRSTSTYHSVNNASQNFALCLLSCMRNNNILYTRQLTFKFFRFFWWICLSHRHIYIYTFCTMLINDCSLYFSISRPHSQSRPMGCHCLLSLFIM